jgi:hypothetical protein
MVFSEAFNYFPILGQILAGSPALGDIEIEIH